MKTTESMLEYLATCSKVSLQSFALARLADRANLRKRISELMDELAEVDIQVRMAEWILVHRQQPAAMRRSACSSSGLKNLFAPLLLANEDGSEDGRELPALGSNPALTALRDVAIQSVARVQHSGALSVEKSRHIA